MKGEAEPSGIPVQAEPILAILKKSGLDYQVKVFNSPAHRASQAARMLDCPLGAIVKSLVFQESGGGQMVLVLVSGENRVDPAVMGNELGFDVEPARPDIVFQLTGFAVGSVPPIGIAGEFQVIFDCDLTQFDRVWAAAGSANVLIGLSPQTLLGLSGGVLARIGMKL